MITSIASLAVVTAVPILIYFYVTREHPKLLYILSDTLELPEATLPSQLLQQLEVRNIGQKEATDILVQFSRPKLDITIKPFSMTDTHKLHANDAGHEISYSKLPPNARFRVLLRGHNSALSSDDVSITHTHGVGFTTTALTHNNYAALFWLGLAIIYIFFCLSSLRSTMVDGLRRQAKWQPNQILIRTKPLYCQLHEWEEILESSLEHWLKNDKAHSVRRITKLPSYIVLDSDKPRGVSDARWPPVLSEARENLIREVTYVEPIPKPLFVSCV